MPSLIRFPMSSECLTSGVPAERPNYRPPPPSPSGWASHRQSITCQCGHTRSRLRAAAAGAVMAARGGREWDEGWSRVSRTRQRGRGGGGDTRLPSVNTRQLCWSGDAVRCTTQVMDSDRVTGLRRDTVEGAVDNTLNSRGAIMTIF